MIKIEELYCQVRDTVQNGNCLTQILFDEIRQVDAQTGEVLRQVNCPNMGGLMGICAIEGGFILHGETELFRRFSRRWMARKHFGSKRIPFIAGIGWGGTMC